VKYTYRDFLSGKLHYTRGEFANWTRGGPLNAWCAVFRRRRSVLFVPEYLLTPETRQALPPPPQASGQALPAEDDTLAMPMSDDEVAPDILAEITRRAETDAVATELFRPKSG
jgi:hypothetical protein